MSDYITPKQFLEQPEEVQEVLRDWWKPGMYDLFFRNFGNNPNNFLHGIFINYIGDNETLINATKDRSFLPLLGETQLRHFIEDKANCYIEIIVGINGYVIVLRAKNTIKEIDRISIAGQHDLLQAYWQVACKVAIEKPLSSEWQECSLNAAAKALFNQEYILAISSDGTQKLFKYEEGDCIPVIKNNHIPIVLLDLPEGTKFYKRNEVNSEDSDYDVIGPNDIAP